MRYVRAAALLAVLGSFTFTAGCQGGSGGATPPVPIQDPASINSSPAEGSQTDTGSPDIGTLSSTTASEDSTITNSLKSFIIRGPIVALKSGGFQMHGGTGYVNIYPTSSTSRFYNRLTPVPGRYAVVTATGTQREPRPLLVALYASSAPAITTVTGKIADEQPYGASLKLSTGAEVPLAFNTATNLHGRVATNVNVSATGLGSVATGVFPTTVTVQGETTGGGSGSTPSPSPVETPGVVSSGIPKHVMTSTVFWGYGGVPTTVPIASAAPYLTWAQTAPEYAALMRRAGIKVDLYINFWRDYGIERPPVGYNDLKPGGPHSAAAARSCSGTFLRDPSYGGGYETDARSSAALGHALVVARYYEAEFGSNYDALFLDDTGALGGMPLPCGWSLASYQSATNRLIAGLGKPVMINSLGAGNSLSQVGYTGASNTFAAMCEICYAGVDKYKRDIVHTDSRWLTIESAQIATIQRHKVFLAYPRAIGDARAETKFRLYAYASFLLTYDPKYAMIQEIFKTPSSFPVLPETGLVPMNPLTTASSIAGYKRSGGAYMREYGACYYHGVNKGRCAVIVNPSGVASASIPTSAYGHGMALSGYGVLDGGTVSFTGARPHSLTPASAAILFQ